MLCLFIQGTGAAADFGVHGGPGIQHGGPGTNPLLNCICSDELHQSSSIQTEILALFSVYRPCTFLEKKRISLPFNHFSHWNLSFFRRVATCLVLNVGKVLGTY